MHINEYWKTDEDTNVKNDIRRFAREAKNKVYNLESELADLKDEREEFIRQARGNSGVLTTIVNYKRSIDAKVKEIAEYKAVIAELLSEEDGEVG